MTTQEIIEGNKLIAEFMAVKNEISDIYYLPQFGHYFNCYGHLEYNECFRLDELKYHSFWDWLMPVVEKIDKIGFNVQIGRISVNISRILDGENTIIGLVCGDIDKKLELVFSACVNFIKWYNQNK